MNYSYLIVIGRSKVTQQWAVKLIKLAPFGAVYSSPGTQYAVLSQLKFMVYWTMPGLFINNPSMVYSICIYCNLKANECSYVYIEVNANYCRNESIKFGYPNVNNVELQTICWTTFTLTYNVWNTAATDIKYVLVESYGPAECFSKVLNSTIIGFLPSAAGSKHLSPPIFPVTCSFFHLGIKFFPFFHVI